MVHAAHLHGVRRLLYLGSSCIYPRECPQPIREEYLLTGLLEPTNEPYAIAKISGIKLCQAYRRQYGCDFISAMPTNLYGPHDNFDLKSSHVLPALMRKFHDAKAAARDEVDGLGHRLAPARVPPRRRPRRRLPLPDAPLRRGRPHQRRHRRGPHHPRARRDRRARSWPPACGSPSIPPSRTARPRKLLDVCRLHALGWRHRIDLAEGIRSTYEWFLENHAQAVSSSHENETAWSASVEGYMKR